jgi:hypothetical protein
MEADIAEEPALPTPHLGQRPTWACAACHQPWPCAQAKRELLTEFHRFPSSLIVYMSSYLTEAMDDLTAPNATAPPDLWDRFLGWARQASADVRAGTPDTEAG